MDTVLKELVENYKARKQDLAEAQERVEKLQLKSAKLQMDIPNLERVVGTMATAKGRALDRYVAEQITQLELDEAKEAHSKAQAVYNDAIEMLEAVRRAERQAVSDVSARVSAFQGAKTRMWRLITERLVLEARAQVNDTLVKAYIAARNAGADHLNASLFEPPSNEFVREMSIALEKEYLTM